MGIAKVNLRKPDNEVLLLHPRVEVGVVHGNDSDSVSNGSSEFTEDAESELVVLGNQMFHVPYDLYDLPDLKGVLSLEAWNVCLTEEERFSLAVFLPDMDQQAFLVTMNELLKGENIFFGSPLDSIFERLKGGICSLKVSCFKEHLQTLERRKYNHSLHSYHDNMVRVFMDMKRTREKQHTVGSSPVFVVDLNALPTDEELCFANKSDRDEDVKVKSSRRRKCCMDSKELPRDVGPSSVNNMPKPRGVLKMKAPKMNSTRCDVVQVFDEHNSWGKRATPKGARHNSYTPKGVLKVRKKAQSQSSRIGLGRMVVGHSGNESYSSVPECCQSSGHIFAVATKTESAGMDPPPVEKSKSVKIKLKILNK